MVGNASSLFPLGWPYWYLSRSCVRLRFALRFYGVFLCDERPHSPWLLVHGTKADVVQAVFEVSSDPSEAVSALVGLSPPANQATDDDSKGSTSQTPAASGDTTATTLDDETTAIIARASQRHARTLEAMQAQRGPSTPSVVQTAAPAGGSEDVARAAAATPPAPPPTPPPPPPPASTTPPASPSAVAATAKIAPTTAGCDEEADSAPAASANDGNGGGSGSAKNVELEKVAAIITSDAGEQKAAAKSSCAPTTPPEPLFAVPREVSVPSTRTAQVVIVNTAEKTIELPGFEAFMKLQHGKDKLFRFLAVDHDLHRYYLLAKQHAREGAMKGGKVKAPRAAAVAVKPSTAPTARAPSEDPDVADIMRIMAGGGVTSP